AGRSRLPQHVGGVSERDPPQLIKAMTPDLGFVGIQQVGAVKPLDQPLEVLAVLEECNQLLLAVPELLPGFALELAHEMRKLAWRSRIIGADRALIAGVEHPGEEIPDPQM